MSLNVGFDWPPANCSTLTGPAKSSILILSHADNASMSNCCRSLTGRVPSNAEKSCGEDTVKGKGKGASFEAIVVSSRLGSYASHTQRRASKRCHGYTCGYFKADVNRTNCS